MQTAASHSSSGSSLIPPPSSLPAVPVPAPRSGPIAIRVATLADLPFLDGLQKKHHKALGYFPTKQFEGYIEMGGVLVAEAASDEAREQAASDEATEQAASDEATERRSDEGNGADRSSSSPCVAPSLRRSVASALDPSSSSPCVAPSLRRSVATPLGYAISRDRYLKRDELGVIYQLCVAPGFQRGLIGATLIKSVFERAAYGCRLFCCWCAQDLEANYFWESLGFVPLAFRVGSTGKKRVHIFWQRRTRAEDVGENATSWWYPFQTNSGALRADRLVFPIPPGVDWRDIRPPEVKAVAEEATKRLSDGATKGKRKTVTSPCVAPSLRRSVAPDGHVAIIVGGRVKYVPKPGAKPAEPEKVAAKAKRAKPSKPTETLTFDPRFLTQNRELRDRCLEQINGRLLIESCGKYDVSRTLASTSPAPDPVPLAPAPLAPAPLAPAPAARLLPAA